MARVITFSRIFPKYHSKEGKPTYFVEKIQKSIDENKSHGQKTLVSSELLPLFNFAVFNDCLPKYHTIRSGNRWKVGDKFSPRVWSGTPYKSKQIIIAPDIEVKKVFSLDVQFISRPFITYKNEKGYCVSYPDGTFEKMTINDGFTDRRDLEEWLLGNKPIYNCGFTGQIICWNENINY